MMEKMLRTRELLLLLCLVIFSVNNCTQKPEIESEEPEYSNFPKVGHQHNTESLNIDSGMIVRTSGIEVHQINLDESYFVTTNDSSSGIDQDVIERIEWKEGDKISLAFSFERRTYIVDYAIDSTAILNDGKNSYARIIFQSSGIPYATEGIYQTRGVKQFYAQYPSGNLYPSGSVQKMDGNIPKEQTGVIDMNHMYMYADNKVTVEKEGYLDHIQLDFKPMFTVLEFTVSANEYMTISNVTLSSANGYLSGPFTTIFRSTNLSQKYPNYSFEYSSKEVKVDLSGLDNREVGDDKYVTFTVLALANDIEGLTLRFEMADSMGTKNISIKNPDGTNYVFAGGMKHKITGLKLWVDTLALKDETGMYQEFIDRPLIDFSADTEYLKTDNYGRPIKFPFYSFSMTVHLLANDDVNKWYSHFFSDAVSKDKKKVYFYIRYYVEPNQWFYWLNLKFMEKSPNNYQEHDILEKEVYFNPATDRRIKYQEKIPITEDMINRMMFQYENYYGLQESLFTLYGSNVTIDGAYITIEDE